MQQAGIYVALVVLIGICGLHASETAQVPAAATPWQQCSFHEEHGDFSNQTLVIINRLEMRGLKCQIENIMKFPFFKNCSESGYLFFAPNKTNLEVIINNTGKTDLLLEYGKGEGEDLQGEELQGEDLRGKKLQATCGELMTDKAVMAKISEYEKSNDSAVDVNQTASHSKDENKTLSKNQVIGIAVGVPLGIFGILLIILLRVFWEKIKSWFTSRYPRLHTALKRFLPTRKANNSIGNRVCRDVY